MVIIGFLINLFFNEIEIELCGLFGDYYVEWLISGSLVLIVLSLFWLRFNNKEEEELE